MTPKQMVEGQVAEFRKLATSSRTAGMDFKKFGMHAKATAHHAQADTFELCADRLESLLKLKGWE